MLEATWLAESWLLLKTVSLPADDDSNAMLVDEAVVRRSEQTDGNQCRLCFFSPPRRRARREKSRKNKTLGHRGHSGHRRTQLRKSGHELAVHLVEGVDAFFLLHAVAATVIAAGVEILLHHLADAGVFDLNLVAEG